MHSERLVKIAILAMGGEGGGVLADWIVEMAEHRGWLAQSTSVPGVAQRTGATLYYVELFDTTGLPGPEASPVLALMPLPGDVDLVLASELMEGARAVQRGLVTPERSTLICSTHRVFALAEKMALGDGRIDSILLLSQAQAAARHCIAFDMERTAQETGSVISAVLFGALAASGRLPFARTEFEATIERGGVGVRPSLRAFARGHAQASGDTPMPPTNQPAAAPSRPAALAPALQALLTRVDDRYSEATRELLLLGLRRLTDYQDPAYAALYLDRIEHLHGLDPAGELTQEVARHLALWMSFEDAIRVADLKTRDTRFERVRGEVGVAAGQLLDIAEYMHPRLQEICDTLPARWGRWLLASRRPRRLVERLAARGRVVSTSSLRGFLLLWCVAALRPLRRGSLRFQQENQRIEAWLGDIAMAARSNLPLACEMARCQRLVKGYGDTHARGLRHFEALRSAWRRAGPRLAAAVLSELREAALADDQGLALHAALRRHALD